MDVQIIRLIWISFFGIGQNGIVITMEISEFGEYSNKKF
jgi:hypothetical protein